VHADIDPAEISKKTAAPKADRRRLPRGHRRPGGRGEGEHGRAREDLTALRAQLDSLRSHHTRMGYRPARRRHVARYVIERTAR